MRWTIGIDEVGRGALAGPVVVAAAALPAGFAPRSRALGALKDSKQLVAKKREAWCEYFAGHPRIEVALARVYPRQIERQNITRAANTAAKRALGRLLGGSAVVRHARHFTVLLDGGLFIGNGIQLKNARTIVKSDEKFAAIKVASIVAKVHRDRLMRHLAKKYPGYGLEFHKGYGTAAHFRAIKKNGPCPVHRLTFLGNQLL